MVKTLQGGCKGITWDTHYRASAVYIRSSDYGLHTMEELQNICGTSGVQDVHATSVAFAHNFRPSHFKAACLCKDRQVSWGLLVKPHTVA